jgi:ssDNA-binding Zn-finger/Zn-ribbon topoisomerase 1
MAKTSGKDIQLSFEFDTSDRKVMFIAVKGECRCGFTGEFKKAEIVLEMTVPCPKCGAVISIK